MSKEDRDKRREEKGKKPFNETGFGIFLKKAVKVLPELADVAMDIVGGPYDMAYDAIRNALGKNKTTQGKELLDEMLMNQRNWEVEMEKNYVQILSINADDRDSARNRENVNTQAGRKDVKQTVVLIIGLAAFVFSIVSTMFLTVPVGNELAWNHLMGVIEGAAAIPIFNYFFGSSAGSKRKTELMNN